MYKSRLQELCQRRSWELPVYSTTKDGSDPMPSFTASVNVNGQDFGTPAKCKSSKDAQNTCAQIAFDFFDAPSQPEPTYAPAAAVSPLQEFPPAAPPPTSPPIAPQPPEKRPAFAPLLPLSPLPSSLPIPPPGFLMEKKAIANPANNEIVQKHSNDTAQTSGSVINRVAIGSPNKQTKDTPHMFKSQLHQFALKKNFDLPVYTTKTEGPPHCCRFKSSVSVNGKLYETPEFFTTMKEAEQAAAKVACQALSVDALQEDGGLHKHLLQELAQKKGLVCPSYECITSGFVSIVEIGSRKIRGAEAKTKKQADMNGAKAAYYALMESCPSKEETSVSSNIQCDVGISFSQNVEPNANITKHQDATAEDTPNMFKSQLHQFALKKNFDLPVYTTKTEGPPHCCRFKSSVSVNGKSYETPEFFTTMKEAEQAAAKVACQALSVDALQEDGGLHKHLLQELAQKKGLVCPSYECITPGFVSIVEIGSRKIRGVEAKTKKQAEINAAKAAYYALMESCPSKEETSVSSNGQCDVGISFSQNVEPNANITKHQDATAEEENTRIKSHLPDPSEDNYVSDDSRNLLPRPVKEQQVKEKTSFCSMTVVVPYKSSLPKPKPEGAYVFPYSNEEWIAYNVEHLHEPTAAQI